MNVLFVTWDGPQVHYLESLFLPIFQRLHDHDLHFDVLQFRWGDPAHTVRIAKRCRAAGIGYRPVPVHRSPPSRARSQRRFWARARSGGLCAISGPTC